MRQSYADIVFFLERRNQSLPLGVRFLVRHVQHKELINNIDPNAEVNPKSTSACVRPSCPALYCRSHARAAPIDGRANAHAELRRRPMAWHTASFAELILSTFASELLRRCSYSDRSRTRPGSAPPSPRLRFWLAGASISHQLSLCQLYETAARSISNLYTTRSTFVAANKWSKGKHCHGQKHKSVRRVGHRWIERTPTSPACSNKEFCFVDDRPHHFARSAVRANRFVTTRSGDPGAAPQFPAARRWSANGSDDGSSRQARLCVPRFLCGRVSALRHRDLSL